MSLATAALVLGIIIGFTGASTIFRAQVRTYTVKLVRAAHGSTSPVVVVELPDDMLPLDATVGRAIAVEVRAALAEGYGWPPNGDIMVAPPEP